MNPFAVNWDLRAIWTASPLLSKFCVLFLLAVAATTLISLARILLRIQRARRPSQAPAGRNVSESIQVANSLTNLRQLHTFSFYFFGLCFSAHLFVAIRIERLLAMLPQSDGVNPFDSFACFVFAGYFMLLIIHSLQWVTFCYFVFKGDGDAA